MTESKNIDSLSSYFERMLGVINPCFYAEHLSPDLVISFSEGFHSDAKDMLHRFPNIQYLINSRVKDNAISNIINVGIKDIATATESLMEPMPLSNILDFYNDYIEMTKKQNRRVSIVLDVSGRLSRIIQSPKISSFEDYIEDLKTEIMEEVLEFSIEDLDEEGIDLFISFSDFYLPSGVKKIPEKIHHELTRTEFFKKFTQEYIEKNSLSMSDPKVFMDYMVMSRPSAKASSAIFDYEVRERGEFVSRFNITDKDLEYLKDAFTELIHIETYQPKRYAVTLKQKSFKANFPFYFNALVKF